MIEQCECEHESHFPSKDDGRHMPMLKAHRYGKSQIDVQPVKTDWGTFHICRACREAGHLKSS